jgi:hypothetical protein
LPASARCQAGEQKEQPDFPFDSHNGSHFTLVGGTAALFTFSYK